MATLSVRNKKLSEEVFLLPLTDQGAPDVPGGYVYLPPPTDPPYILRFSIEGTSSICRQGSLWVNFPAEGESFVRGRFREIKLRPDFSRSLEISIPITSPGPFAFYTTYTPLPELSLQASKPPSPTQTETFYVDVPPRLTINKEYIPLDALSCISVLSKLMGKYPHDWDKHIKSISARSYNMVHFTPLMQRGESNSPYSIYDQLKFDPTCFPRGEKDVSELVGRMEREHGLLSITDVVWNHTSNNSPWLEAHPEVGYSVKTAPWLESALQLDTALLEFSKQLKDLSLPTTVASIEDLKILSNGIKTNVIYKLDLWQYYVVDVAGAADAAMKAWAEGDVITLEGGSEVENDIKSWSVKERADYLSRRGLRGKDRLGERYHRTVDLKTGASVLTAIFGSYDSQSPNPDDVRSAYIEIVDIVNVPLYREYDADVAVTLDQIFNRVKYMRLDDHGPKLGPISEDQPLVESYFTRLPQNPTTSKHDQKSLALVNNGWIWNADAMIDHAGPSSKAYLRREVIVWMDCVKLKYGTRPEDNPYLWEHMTNYSRLMAKYFAGFRIDNCHTTPIAVAEYFLDQARQVRSNLFICAELFTGSEPMDYVFVKRLGLSSLVREAMQAWSVAELSRLVHRHGGRPIGSFETDEAASNASAISFSTDGNAPKEKLERVHQIKETPVHALFMDCTHDNQPPAQKRDARDTLPNAALVSICACATGSVMGYDEVYPQYVDLVSESRQYLSSLSGEEGCVDGIGKIKKILNDIHTLTGKGGYDETFINHEGEFITVHRMHSKTRKGYFLIARTAFPDTLNSGDNLKPVHLVGTKARHVGTWQLEVDDSDKAKEAVREDSKRLRGLPSRVIDLDTARLVVNDEESVIELPNGLPPGTISLFETWIPGAEHSEGLDSFLVSGAREAFLSVDLFDLNAIMYRCEAEERDASSGSDGVYTLPESGPLVYAGLQGWWSLLKDIIRYNDLGHPLCQNLRSGQWALDYIVGRMERLSKQKVGAGMQKPAAWLKSRFQAARVLPSFLLPRYFALIVQTAYNAAWGRGLDLMSENIRRGQPFLQRLALVSVQQTGYLKSASLYPTESVPCLAAGLPHFATDWARCWGRDVFISLRGLFLSTGRHDEAKAHILAFASVLKHGLIPNLLSRGKSPRYNARDSVWFFLQSIQDFVKMVPNGEQILKERIWRRFLPYDDTWFEYDDSRAYSTASTLEDIIQEAIQRHATGISFQEANAGSGLDMQMKPEGFQIDVNVDWETGLIFGGSQDNCGTWQDKMGESDKAGSKGVPGTPRDGAAIEITGLAYSTLVWLKDLHQKAKFSYKGVQLGEKKAQILTFGDWASRIEGSFERSYYIPLDPYEDSNYDINPKIVNRRGIYKDLYRSGKEYEDYQLRANFPIAMCVAPQLFDPNKALQALMTADTVLRGPTGMATLDPEDLNYRPYYNNSEDSSDFATSKGRNYHQGPEWLWPTGYFLRALLYFDLLRRKTEEERTESFQQVTRRLDGCKKAIVDSPWAGLAELTNKNGEFCADSSPTQAWSAGCLIDLFHDASELAKA
ncbi:MAG: hypothetical protein M1833_006471 [Piccolia ochrophora]|nr:MAG: hypothetical protein M1833_006471 [Piccolia ochrophora]